MERKVCFILDASNWKGGGQRIGYTPVQRPTPPPCNQGTRVSIDRRGGARGGGYMQKQHSQLWPSSWNWSVVAWPAWLFEAQLIFSPRVGVFPFPWGWFLELWKLMSQLQSDNQVVNVSHLVGFSVSKTAHRIWLRIFSLALEKEIKVPEFA